MGPALTAALLLAAYGILTLSARPSLVAPSKGSPRRAPAGITDATLMLDLMGAMLAAGAPADHALSVLADMVEEPVARRITHAVASLSLGSEWEAAWQAGPDPPAGAWDPLRQGSRLTAAAAGRRPLGRWGSGRRAQGQRTAGVDAAAELRDALRFAALTGAPSAAIVHACAGQLRRRQNRDLERRAAALGVKLVVPLGVCALPAFVCLGVVPVVLALLP